jgi:predicted RNase H-like HicB family nuclease
MEPSAVKVPVITPVPIECEFWPEDDGWKGTCSELAISVRGGNFEQAKENMEAALEGYISSVQRDRGATIAA